VLSLHLNNFKLLNDDLLHEVEVRLLTVTEVKSSHSRQVSIILHSSFLPSEFQHLISQLVLRLLRNIIGAPLTELRFHTSPQA
jgi:hypothetical protein